MSLILRGYTALLQRLIEIGAIGSTLIPSLLYSATNAIWESTTGAAALGAYLPDIMPHDHGPEGGGAHLPRGCIYSFDIGDSSTSFQDTAPGVATWSQFHDRAAYDFPAFVSPGIDSSSTNVSAGTCYLIAKLLAGASATGGEIRLANKNRTSSPTESSGVAITTAASWHTISTVPCSGGTWNEFDVEWQQTIAHAQVVTLYALSLHEIRATSQPASAGVSTYSAVPRP